MEELQQSNTLNNLQGYFKMEYKIGQIIQRKDSALEWEIVDIDKDNYKEFVFFLEAYNKIGGRNIRVTKSSIDKNWKIIGRNMNSDEGKSILLKKYKNLTLILFAKNNEAVRYEVEDYNSIDGHYAVDVFDEIEKALIRFEELKGVKDNE